MVEPLFYLDLAVRTAEPFVDDCRGPLAVVLFAIVAFRPKAGASHCVLAGRVLVLMACILWFAGLVAHLPPVTTIGDWIAFLSLMASHVCDVVWRWPQLIAEKRATGVSPG